MRISTKVQGSTCVISTLLICWSCDLFIILFPSHYSNIVQNMRSGLYNMKNRLWSDGFSTTSREFRPCPLRQPYPLPAALWRSDCGCKSLSTLHACHRPQAATLAFRYRYFSLIYGVPVVWLGTKRTYPTYPMLPRRYLPGFSFSRFKTKSLQREARKGNALPI